MNTTTIEKVELWKQRIADYQSSGLSATTWCQQHSLNIHTLRYWLKKLNDVTQEECASSFIQIIPNIASVPLKSGIVLRIEDYLIDVDHDYDELTLLRLLETLKKC